MTDIWSFTIQTIEASLIALLVLLARLLMKNNLSPILRYVLWFLLAVRILSPAGIFYRYINPRLAIMLETSKSITEASLNSTYISQYSPIHVSHPIPWIINNPSSITDWTFVVYVSGVILFFIIYTCLIGRKIKAIAPISSRITYTMQYLFWSILRSINWCNPILQYAFFILSKDMDCLYDNKEHYGVNKAKGSFILYISIAITILIPSLFGISSPTLYNIGSGKWSFQYAYASARISRCTTVAGAIDTYAKAMMYYNPVYMAAVSTMDVQKDVIDGNLYPPMYDLTTISQQYEVYNLSKEDDTTYSALIVFHAKKLLKENGEYYTFIDSNGNTHDSDGHYIHPVTINKENGWIISSAGERQIVINGSVQDDDVTLARIPYLNILHGKCSSGEITIEEQSIYSIVNTIESNDPMFGSLFGNSYDRTAKLNAQFDSLNTNVTYSYEYTGTKDEKKTIRSAGIAIREVGPGISDDIFMNEIYGDMSSVSNYLQYTNHSTSVSWDGTVTGVGGIGKDPDDKKIFPSSYKVRIYWNGKPIDTVEVKRGDGL